MNRSLIAPSLIAIVCIAAVAQAAQSAIRPNILIIFTDDQGYGDVGCYGNEKIKTPRLDRLASEGTRFTSFYAQCVCGPSRSALLTGRYPSRSKGWSMPADEITWAELMRAAGYETVCVGKWDVSNRKPIIDRMPNAQGFDYYFGPLGANDGGTVKFHENNEAAGSTKDMGSLTKLYTDKAIAFLRGRDDDSKPFALYVAHTMMHTIIDASPAFRGKSDGDLYGDVVEEFDYETGRLLDTIDQLGLTDDTLIIYTSDNGPWCQSAYYEKKKGHPPGSIFWGSPGPLRGGKGSAYEAGSRVPCIVRWPGRVPAGRVSDALFSTLDFLPTFAGLCGFDVPDDRVIDGVDQTDLLLEKSNKGARETYFYDHVLQQRVGVRQGKWKLLMPGRAPTKPHRFLMDFGTDDYELYDLDADIGERRNLAAKHPDRVKKLAGLITDAAPTKKKLIVFLAGGPSHGYGAHEHRAGFELLAKRLEAADVGIETRIVIGWPDDVSLLTKADAVVINSDGGTKHLAADHTEDLKQLTDTGVSIGMMHYAVIPPDEAAWPVYRDAMGGYYETFWSVNPIWEAEFTRLPEHPVTRGVRPFTIRDEWYFHMRFQPEMKGVTPLLTAIPPDAMRQRKDGAHSGNPHVRAALGQPEHVAWVYERPGGGRGFGFTGAHWHWNWAHDDYRTLVLNALVWLAGGDVPEGGVPSETPTLDELLGNLDGKPSPKFNREAIATMVDGWREASTPSHGKTWTVVSIPDFLNVDTDYPQEGWEGALGYVLDKIKAEDPDFVLVAGDLVMGHWDRGDKGIDHWADRYYPAWKQRMKDHDLPWYAAIGDHEVSDNPWPPPKAELVPQFKNAFRKHLAMPLNGPEQMKGTAYSFVHKNTLFVSLDVFEPNRPGEAGYVNRKRGSQGGYEPKVTGEQLKWLEATLKANSNVDHTIVMGHTPILTPVRRWSSSGLTLLGGETSGVWKLMKRHKVDVYLCGEVHDITCKEDGGIEHIAHGALFGYNDKVNYLVMTIAPERIDLELKRLDIVLDGQKLWQTGTNRPQETVRVTPEARKQGFQSVGAMTIDKATETKRLIDKTGLFTPEANTPQKIEADNQRNNAYSRHRRELGLR